MISVIDWVVKCASGINNNATGAWYNTGSCCYRFYLSQSVFVY